MLRVRMPRASQSSTTRRSIAPDNLDQVGLYQISLTAKFPLYGIKYVQTFKVNVAEFVAKIDELQKVNTAPYFNGIINLPPREIAVGGKVIIQLPKVIDDEGDTVSVVVSFSSSALNSYVRYEEVGSLLVFNLPKELVGLNEQVYITLRDQFLFNTYIFDAFFVKGQEQKIEDDETNLNEVRLEQQKLGEKFASILVEEFMIDKDKDQQQRDLLKLAENECVPEKFQAFNNGTIQFTFRNEIELKKTAKLLQQIKEAGSIQLQLIKADGDIPFTDFDWTLNATNSFTLRLTLEFQDPESISSSSSGKDVLLVTFKDTSQFLRCPFILFHRELQVSATIPKDFSLIIKLPMQRSIKPKRADIIQNEIGSVVSSTEFTAVMWTSLAANYIVGFSAVYIWGGINALQLITSTALFQVIIPDNSKKLFSYLKMMSRFDMFYDIYNPIAKMNYTNTTAFNEQFDDLGLSSVCYFDVLGSMTVVLAFTAFTQVLQVLLHCCARFTRINQKSCFKKFVARHKFMQQDRYSVVNTWVRMVLETYMDMAIAAVLAFYSPKFIDQVGGQMNGWDKFNYWTAVVTLAMLGILTLVLLYLVCKRFRLPVSKEKVNRDLSDVKKLTKFYEELVQEEIAEEEKLEQKAKTKDQLLLDPFESEIDLSPRPSLNKISLIFPETQKNPLTIDRLQLQDDADLEDPRAPSRDIQPEATAIKRLNTLQQKRKARLGLKPDENIVVENEEIQAKTLELLRTVRLGFTKDVNTPLANEQYSGGSLEDQEQQNNSREERKGGEVINGNQGDQEEQKRFSPEANRHVIIEEENLVAIVLSGGRHQLLIDQEEHKERLDVSDQEQDDLDIWQIQVSKQQISSDFAISSQSSSSDIWAQNSDKLPQPRRNNFHQRSQVKKFSSEQNIFEEVKDAGRLVLSKRATDYEKRQESIRNLISGKNLGENSQSLFNRKQSSEYRSSHQISNKSAKTGNLFDNNLRCLLQEQINLKLKKKKLKKEKEGSFNIEYVSALREGLKSGSQKTLYYHLFFIARRILLIISAVLLTDQNMTHFLVLMFAWATQFAMIYQAYVYPFETKADNRLELFNEFFVLWIAYHHLIILGLHFDQKQFKAFGLSIDVSIAIMGGTNLLLNYACSIFALFRTLKRLVTTSRSSLCKKSKKYETSTDNSAVLQVGHPERHNVSQQEFDSIIEKQGAEEGSRDSDKKFVISLQQIRQPKVREVNAEGRPTLRQILQRGSKKKFLQIQELPFHLRYGHRGDKPVAVIQTQQTPRTREQKFLQIQELPFHLRYGHRGDKPVAVIQTQQTPRKRTKKNTQLIADEAIESIVQSRPSQMLNVSSSAINYEANKSPLQSEVIDNTNNLSYGQRFETIPNSSQLLMTESLKVEEKRAISRFKSELSLLPDKS